VRSAEVVRFEELRALEALRAGERDVFLVEDIHWHSLIAPGWRRGYDLRIGDPELERRP